MSVHDSNSGVPSRRPTALEREALEWVAQLDRGMTPDQQAEFDRWLSADLRHAAVFEEFNGTWALLDRVRELPEPLGVESDESRRQPMSPRSGGEASLNGEGAAWFRRRAAAADSASSARRATVRRWALPVSLAAAAVFVVAYLRWPLRNVVGERGAAYAVNVATDLGEQRKVALPDGSVVHLNTDSAVDVQFSPSNRRLRLTRGEANFTVAKNPARPFTVSAGGVDVRAVGTVFNVRLRSAAVEVLVTEGKVMVGDEPSQSGPAEAASAAVADSSADARTPHPPPLARRAVSAGEKITIAVLPGSTVASTAVAPVVVPVVEIEHTLAWQERRLEFVSAPLAEMVAEFNRYNRRKLVIGDAALAVQRFGGVFRPDDAASFVRALEVNFGIVAEQRADDTVLRLATP